MDTFAPMLEFENFNSQYGLWNPRNVSHADARAYSACSVFFESIVEALGALDGRVKLEVLCGEVIEELKKIQHGTNHHRPAEFPRTFTKIWLSNVP